MAYRIRKTKSVQKSVRKIALEQIDKAIEEILDEELDRHRTVHQVRKRCKKLRGLIRLVRPAFDDYRRENRFFRDAARELSTVRDAQSIIDCFDDLVEHFRDQIGNDTFAQARAELAARRQKVADDRVGVESQLDVFLVGMREARERAARWKIDDDGFSAVEGGLAKSYRRGRKAFVRVRRNPTTENLHEWRKRVKYHGYHGRLLRRIWPDMMSVWRGATDELAELLGDDHDLAVLRRTLLEDPDRFGSDSDLQALVALIDRRRTELQASARLLGERVFAEEPDRLRSRLSRYWKTWKTWKTTKDHPRALHERSDVESPTGPSS